MYNGQGREREKGKLHGSVRRIRYLKYCARWGRNKNKYDLKT